MPGSDRDTAARWQLVTPYRDRLVGIARRAGASPTDAEDCAQEAMLRCVEFADLDPSRVAPLLVSITSRLAVDRARARDRDRRLAAKLTGWESNDRAPDDEVCDRAEAAWLWTVVGDLPEHHRAAVEARADGYSFAEVAGQVSLSYKTIEGLFGRLRARARAAVTSSYLGVVAWQRRWRPASELLAPVIVVASAFVLSLPGARPADAAPNAPQRIPVPVILMTSAPRPTPEPRPQPAPPVAAGAPSTTTSPVLTTPASSRPSGTPVPCMTFDSGPFPMCVPLGPDPNYAPGERVLDCVVYGVDTSRGFQCRHSPPSETAEPPSRG